MELKIWEREDPEDSSNFVFLGERWNGISKIDNYYILSTLKNLIDDSSSETKVRRTKFVRENDDSEIESTDKNHFVEKEIMIFKARLINQIPDWIR